MTIISIDDDVNEDDNDIDDDKEDDYNDVESNLSILFLIYASRRIIPVYIPVLFTFKYIQVYIYTFKTKIEYIRLSIYPNHFRQVGYFSIIPITSERLDTFQLSQSI